MTSIMERDMVSLTPNTKSPTQRNKRRRRRTKSKRAQSTEIHSEGGSSTGGVSIMTAIDVSTNRFAPLRSTSTYNTEIPLETPSELAQVNFGVTEDLPPRDDAEPWFPVQKRRRRIRRQYTRLRGPASSDKTRQMMSTKPFIPRKRTGSIPSDTTPPFSSPRNTNICTPNSFHSCDSPTTTFSWPTKSGPSAVRSALVNPKLDLLQRTTVDQNPFETCSVFPLQPEIPGGPSFDSDFVSIIKTLLPEPQTYGARSHTSFGQHSSLAELEEAFHPLIIQEFEKTPMPSTRDKRSRFFGRNRSYFSPSRDPIKRPGDFPTIAYGDDTIKPAAQPGGGGRQLSTPKHPAESPWKLRPEESDILDQWRKDWCSGNVQELGEGLGQEWMDDEQILAALRGNLEPEQSEKAEQSRKVNKSGGEAVNGWVLVDG